MNKFKLTFYILILFTFVYSYSFKYSDDDLRDAINKVRSNEITTDELKAHIRYLASDDLEGRFPGTRGDSLTESYIENEFKNYGLLPGNGDSYRQNFDITSDVKLGDDNKMTLYVDEKEFKLKPGSEYTPLGISSNAMVKFGLVFAGYGITSAEQNYDDYKDIDALGKIVVILKHSPGYNNPHDNPFDKFEQINFKITTAKQKGALGIIVINGPEDENDDRLMKLRGDNFSGDAGIPVVNVKREYIEKCFELNGKKLAEVQKSINETKTPASFILKKSSAMIQTNVLKVKSSTSNIMGFLEGSDPVLKNEVIVIGAHKDHLGDGTKYGSLNDKNPAIHNGADDNASGTSGVLEVAQKLSSVKSSLKRSYLFMLFGSEEAGLLGSAYFTKSELFSRYNIVAMINMDMIGRLDNNKLSIGGTGTSSVWVPVLDSLNKIYEFTAGYKPEGFGPSDHSSFYAKDLPVLFFFTSLHTDYHRPSDDWDKINYDGEKKILEMVYSLINTLDNLSGKPDFVKTVSDKNDKQGPQLRVTLGIIPDYSSTDEGLAVLGVKEGGVGEKSGILKGDVIIKFGGDDIKNIYDYMGALSKCKPGDEVEVVVKRNGENVTLKVEFKK